MYDCRTTDIVPLMKRAVIIGATSGLGLEGARRRVESLGGSLSVSQGEGRWTTILSVPFQAVP